MTICIAVGVHDGMVFAADSASTLSTVAPGGATSVLNVYMHGQKVFNLYKGKPIAAMTCGIGNFGPHSISSLAKELRFILTNGSSDEAINADNYSIHEIVEKTRKFLYDDKFARLSPRPNGHFEFWVAGYPSDMSQAFELWKIVFSEGQCQPPVKLTENGGGGIWWGGAIEPVTRLVLGFDDGMRRGICKASGVDPDNVPPEQAAKLSHLIECVRNESQVYLHSPAMPMQDAIDLADFLAATAKQYWRFLPGADIVGGETDIATVTRYEGFKWIRRKHYYPRELNVLETDHA